VTVERTAPDDRYGNATIPPSEVSRLSVANRVVVTVNGTVQTAATPDGGGNADNLWLAARGETSGSLEMGPKFAVAAIPSAVKFTAAEVESGVEITNPRKWHWGVKYTWIVESDSGAVADLADAKVGEVLKKIGDGSGFLGKLGTFASDRWEDANPPAGVILV